jgi:peptidyl-prolyl cis-trans isomerase A (cyclophilin A)
LKADAEAAMEKLAAGLKTESGLRYQFIQRGEGKQAVAGKQFPYTMKDR